MLPILPHVRPGSSHTAAQQTALAEAAFGTSQMAGGGGLTAEHTGAGVQIIDRRVRPFWVRITGSAVIDGRTAYSWVQADDSSPALPDGSPQAFAAGAAPGWPAYDVTGAGVTTGTKVRLYPSPTGSFWLFTPGGGGAAGQFFARVSASSAGPPVTYTIVEAEIDPATDASRDKDGGRTGTAYRHSSAEVDPPAIPVNQIVLASPSATAPGSYEITPWGGQFRFTRTRLDDMDGSVLPNPSDCDEQLIIFVKYRVTERLNGREICEAVAPAGEDDTGS